MRYYKDYQLEYADCGESGQLKLPRIGRGQRHERAG